ncbi:unnamed protein product [Sympodiomycopsis kandeliae]
MSSSLPPSLLIAPRGESQNVSQSTSKSIAPNLMPFDIDYTGPANVDGYFITHHNKDSEYSHFRGRRMYNTQVSLPENWIANVYSVDRNQPLDVPESSGSQDRQIKERQERLLQQQRKKRKVSNVVGHQKPKAVMTSFSMDDDDEEDEHEQARTAEEPQSEEDQQDEEDHPDDFNSPQENDEISSLPESRLPIKTTTLTPVSSEPCKHINVWNPDGPLDMGDDELVKVLSEWTAITNLIHAS